MTARCEKSGTNAACKKTCPCWEWSTPTSTSDHRITSHPNVAYIGAPARAAKYIDVGAGAYDLDIDADTYDLDIDAEEGPRSMVSAMDI